MSITKQASGDIVCADEGINIFCMIAAKGAIKLESLGMKHSSGRSVRKAWAVKLGMKPNAKHADVIAELQNRIDAAHQGGV